MEEVNSLPISNDTQAPIAIPTPTSTSPENAIIPSLETSQQSPGQTEPSAQIEQKIDFDQLQADYDLILKDLGDSESLQKFKLEYTKLFESLKQSRENEQIISERCKDLQNQMASQTSQLQNAMKLAQSDRNTIGNLKKDIKKSWEMVEDAKEREEKTRETIQQLRAELSVLQNALQQTQVAEMGHEQALSDLMRQKEDLTKERDTQVNQILQLRTELEELVEKSKALEQSKQKSEEEIDQLKNNINQKKNEYDKEVRNREKLERDLKEAKFTIEEKNTEIKSKQESLMRLKEEISRQELHLKEQKNVLEKSAREHEQLLLKAARLQQDYEEQLSATNHLVNENSIKTEELKTREESIARLKDDLKSSVKQREMLQKKLKQVEDQKRQVEIERDQMKAINHSLEKDLELYKRQVDNEKRKVEDLARERDIINKSLQKTNASSSKQQTLLTMQEQIKKNLEQDIQAYKEEAMKQRKIIFTLEKERDKFITEATNAQNQLMDNLEQLKVKENEILEYKKKIAEVETKLKQQQNLYEAVRTDRNMYSKNLIESQDEINDLKRKLKVIQHQIDQMKEEIHSKDNQLSKQTQEYQKCEKERENLKADLQRLKRQSEVTEQYYRNQQAEEQKLRTLVHQAECELAKQKREIEQVVQERDIINAQLSKRNDEVALLYEKIKLQQSILEKGEAQYRERIEDVKVLKIEIENLRRERSALQKEVIHVEQLKTEVVKLEKEVSREKSRIKVLENQLQNPVNVHRWRKLEGTEPEMFELLQKVQTLQKRLIAKTEEVIEKELMIQQKEKLYEEMKVILARQPGPEVAEQLSECQQAIREKSNQLKSMKSELKMYHDMVNEYKSEIERMNREMLNLKKMFYENKKKDQKRKPLLKHHPKMYRFTTTQFMVNFSPDTGEESLDKALGIIQ